MPKKIWQRDLKMEERGKKNFLYRVGVLVGIGFAWLVVGTGWASFLSLSSATFGVLFLMTIWDMRKMWKGK